MIFKILKISDVCGMKYT